MKKPNNSNHRDKSDRQRAREMADQKSENGRLRRQVARLQREVDRLEFVGSVEEYTLEVIKPKQKQKSCQACGETKLKEMTTPNNKIIVICSKCTTRQIN